MEASISNRRCTFGNAITSFMSRRHLEVYLEIKQGHLPLILRLANVTEIELFIKDLSGDRSVNSVINQNLWLLFCCQIRDSVTIEEEK
jgi:hypothetical protein